MDLRPSLALAASLLVSCSGTVDSVPASGLPEASFADAYAHAACDNLTPCCESAGYDRAQDDCLESVREEVRQWEEAARAAGASYDPVTGKHCVELQRAITDRCLTFKDSIPYSGSCYQVFTGGNKGQGEACNLWDCADSAGCLWIGEPERVCTAYRIGRDGEPCPTGDDVWVMCESGLFCLDWVCSRPHAIGEPCKDGAHGDMCESGTTCDWHDTKTCVTARALGEACTDQTQCEGYRCVEGTCVRGAMVTGRCVR